MNGSLREFFSRRSPRTGKGIVALWLTCWLTTTSPAFAGLPQGGKITHGEGNISTPSANQMQINQYTQRMAADFVSFDIAGNHGVNISQPGASSVFLGNITGESATQIFGTLTANGSVMLMNPRGVVFGETSRVDTASLMATTLGVDVDKFMSGALELEFSADIAGKIINRGVLNAASGGSITLLGDEVINEGLIVADMGRVNLASASQAFVTFDPDGLIGVRVTEGALGGTGGEAAVANLGEIDANGGQILLTAHAARDLFTMAVNNEGVLRATRAQEVDGEIRLFASGGDTFTSGTIEATADNGTGGSIEVLGDRVAVTAGRIDASGAGGGGDIKIGGAFQGKGDTPTASHTYVGQNAKIAADATVAGDGGEVIVWADNTTRFHGEISARGGPEGGDGGFVEVSGKKHLVYRGTTDTRAPQGEMGTLLLDPDNITVETGAVDSGDNDDDLIGGEILFADGAGTDFTITNAKIEEQLENATVVLQAEIDITQLAGAHIDVSENGAAAGSGLTLQAGRNITLNANILLNNGDLTLSADDPGQIGGSDGIGNISLNGTTYSTGTGAISLTLNDAAGTATIAGTFNGGSVSIDAETIALDGGSVNTFAAGDEDGSQSYVGAVTLGADTSLTATGDITFIGTLDGTTAETETLDLTAGTGSVTFDSVVGSTTALGAVNVVSAEDLSLNAAFTAASLTQTTGTGTTTVGGLLSTSGNVSLTSDAIAVNAGIDTATAAAGGTVTLGAGDVLNIADAIASAGAVSLTGTNTLNAAGSITTAGDTVVVNSAATLTGGLTVDTTDASAAGANITFNAVDGGHTLALTAGAGSVTFDEAVGGGTALSAVSLLSANDADFAGVTANTVTLTAAGGAVSFNGPLTTTTLLVAGAINDLALNAGGTIADAVTFANTGTLTLGDDAGASITFTGGVTATAPSMVNMAGTVATTDAAMTFADLTLDDATTLTTGAGGGNLVVGDVTANTESLSLDAGTGNIGVDSFTNGGNLTVVNSTNANFFGAVTAEAISLQNTAGTIAFDLAATADSITADANDFAVTFALSPTVTGAGSFENDGGVTFNAGGSFGDGLTVAGPTTLTGTLTTANSLIDLSDVTLAGTAALASGGGNITMEGVISGGNALSLNGGETGEISLASFLAGGDLTVVDSANTTFTGEVTAGEVTLVDTQGLIAFQGDTNIATLTTAAEDYDLALTGTTNTVGGATTFANAGTLTLGDEADDSIMFTDGVTATAPSAVNLAGTITTTNAAMTFADVTLGAATTLTTGAGAGDLVAGTVTSAGNALNLNAGTGSIDVAAFDNGGNLTVLNSGGATFAGGIGAGALSLEDTDGTIAFGSAVNATSITADANGFDVTFAEAPDVTGAGTFNNAGGVTFNAGGSFGDGLTASGPTMLTGSLTTANSLIDLNGLALGGTAALVSGGGPITTGAITSGGNPLFLNAGAAGEITVTSFADGGDLTVVDSANTTFTGEVTAGEVTLVDTQGLIAFQGDTNIATLTTAAEDYDLALTGTTNTVGGATTFANAGTLTLGDEADDSIMFTDGVTATAPSAVNLAGTITTTNAAMTFADVTLGAATTLTTGAGAGDLVAGTVTSAGNALNLNAGTGSIDVAAFDNGGNLTVLNSGGATFAGGIGAGALSLEDTDGTIA
ncbi:MAG: filamentous hemagglutinin N-terminal domain-containing protein, partial [Gammaproteobacteria bacterium]